MATVFDKILDTTTGRKSYDWYRKKVRSMTTPSARTLISQGKATIRPKYGIMNLFGYVSLDATLQYSHINRPDFFEVYHRLHPRGQKNTGEKR